MSGIHTCSYSCEMPECIKAQRDELVARLEAQMDQASGNAEYLAYLEAAIDEAGFVIKHDGGTLGNSNFRLEPKTQSAAAQAAAWQVGDEFYPSESLAIEAIQQWGPSGAIAIPLYAAASVTAAPGVDLEQFREAVAYWRDTALRDMQYQNGLLHEQANEGQRLLDLIDAIANGGNDEAAWSAGYQAAMNEAASGVQELYRNHVHHMGSDGLIARAMQLEQNFLRDGAMQVQASTH